MPIRTHTDSDADPPEGMWVVAHDPDYQWDDGPPDEIPWERMPHLYLSFLE